MEYLLMNDIKPLYVSYKYLKPFHRNELWYFLFEYDSRNKQIRQYLEMISLKLLERNYADVVRCWEAYNMDYAVLRPIITFICHGLGLAKGSQTIDLLVPYDQLFYFLYHDDWQAKNETYRCICQEYGVLFYEFQYYIAYKNQNYDSIPDFKSMSSEDFKEIHQTYKDNFNSITAYDLVDCIMKYKNEERKRTYNFDFYDV